MKRYLLFTGEFYYPHGGMNDFWADFDSLKELFSEQSLWGKGCDWFHIHDSILGQTKEGRYTHIEEVKEEMLKEEKEATQNKLDDDFRSPSFDFYDEFEDPKLTEELQEHHKDYKSLKD